MNLRELGTYYSILYFIDRVTSKISRFKIDEGLWQADEDMRDMLYTSIQQIGEKAASLNATNAITDFPEVHWKEIIGLRNILVHDYDAIDATIVWDVITNDLPRLRHELLANKDVSTFYEQQTTLSSSAAARTLPVVGGLDVSAESLLDKAPLLDDLEKLLAD